MCIRDRLRTARGQIDGVLKMIEDNRYCMDIMMQLQAVESLVHKAQREVPVSYTHLDVYKRQLLNVAAGKGKKIAPLMYVLAVLFVLKYIFL